MSEYLKSAQRNLPRLLSLFDLNPISRTNGLGHRYYWSWKGVDYLNGSFQGAANGLSRLLVHELIPHRIDPTFIHNTILQVIAATARISKQDNYFNEIMPNERSHCVTALVAFDTLAAIDTLSGANWHIDVGEALDGIRPLISFISTNRELHGNITNHKAVALASLGLWSKLSGDDVSEHIERLLSEIRLGFSDEGWFQEYLGADFGYQTLTLDYLTAFDESDTGYRIDKELTKSVEFLSYGAFPNGAFGGHVGSRNTQFLYPAGIETIGRSNKSGAALAYFARKAHSLKSLVGLDAMDEPNFITMFNSYCRSVTLSGKLMDADSMPFEGNDFLKEYPEAGILALKNSVGYHLINWRNGGTIVSSCGVTSGGVLAKGFNREYFTSRNALKCALVRLENGILTMRFSMHKYVQRFPNSFHFIVLRLLGGSLLKFSVFNWLVKAALVQWVMFGNRKIHGEVERTIDLNSFVIKDTWINNPKRLTMCGVTSFGVQHMASQNYWQANSDVPTMEASAQSGSAARID